MLVAAAELGRLAEGQLGGVHRQLRVDSLVAVFVVVVGTVLVEATTEHDACATGFRVGGHKSEGSQDCIWGLWDEWSECSASCGGGQTSRTRRIAQMPRAVMLLKKSYPNDDSSDKFIYQLMHFDGIFES